MTRIIEKPAIDPGEHPIETTRYLLETPAVMALCAQVEQWVRNRIPGALIYGRPRRGKTKAIEILVEYLREVFFALPIVTMPAFDRTVPNEKAFLEKLLIESGHALVKKGDLEDKLARLVNFLAQKAELSRQCRVVLIIDEAQVLQQRHYSWLSGLHNELDRKRINLIVLLVGQHQLLQIRSGFVATEKDQIVDRFMVQCREFHGIRNVQELEECLKGYDEDSEYPANSGWSFTQFYLPEWFDNGGRLQRLAADFWAAITEAWQAGKRQISREMPMQHFARTVEHFLRLGTKTDRKGEPLYDYNDASSVREAIRRALQESGYVSALTIEWKPKQ